MNRNFYIYKNRISGENIEDNSVVKSIDNFIMKRKVSRLKGSLDHPATSGKVLEGGLRTINTVRGKGPGLKKPKPQTIEDVARDYNEEEAQKPTKTGNEALNSKVKKQDVYSIPPTFDEYDDFSGDYDEPRSLELVRHDKLVESPKYEQQEKEDRRKYNEAIKRTESY